MAYSLHDFDDRRTWTPGPHRCVGHPYCVRERFPDDVIIGEEYGTQGSNPDRRWILDPLDGTKSFVHGVPIYGVLIALEEDGTVTNGVVHLPAMKETISASKGNGCFWNGA